MKTSDLVTIVLGIGTITLGVLVPATGAYAIPTGIGLVVAGIPQLSGVLEAAKTKLQQPKNP